MSAEKLFFHADQVGSLLRPESLLKAWAANRAGTMPDAELLALQDEAVTAAIVRERRALEDYIRRHPAFGRACAPLSALPDAPDRRCGKIVANGMPAHRSAERN
mgnify:CR=1 FL=1